MSANQVPMKFVDKYMHIARSVADDNDACYSRQIGVVIADRNNRIVSLGYNGPPQGTPHCDDYQYLKDFFIPQLTIGELDKLIPEIVPNQPFQARKLMNDWCINNSGCGTCPRRFINAGPGERSTLCSCQHAERNAITNAKESLDNAVMYCWCGVPCIDCTGAIINAGIKTVYHLDHPDYHTTSRWLFEQANVELIPYHG
jgi:deoxycytidylate deaminase